MKINLPNPEEYLHREDLWFEQLELCIYHAKKAWSKVKEQERYIDASLDSGEYPWIQLKHPKEIEDALDGVDPDVKERQNISICIEEL